MSHRLAAALVVALPLLGTLALPPSAHAQELISTVSVRVDKAEYKLAKKRLKEIERITRKWTKAWEKDSQRKMHKVDEDLEVWRREMLAHLRDAGVSTKAPGADDDAPVREAFRDMLVELRDKQARFDDETAPKGMYKRKATLLLQIVDEQGKRVARREARWKRNRDALKNNR